MAIQARKSHPTEHKATGRSRRRLQRRTRKEARLRGLPGGMDCSRETWGLDTLIGAFRINGRRAWSGRWSAAKTIPFGQIRVLQ